MKSKAARKVHGSITGHVTEETGLIKRSFDLDRLKSIAISLVVFGHVVARNPPPGGEWFWLIKDLLYQLHMPVFMFISGFLFFSNNYLTTSDGYRAMVRKRMVRLLLPFFLMGVVVVLLKYVLSPYVLVDNPVDDPILALINILNIQGQSPATFIWYLFVLFLYSAVAPLLLSIFRRLSMMLFISIALMFVSDRMTMFFLEYAFKLFIFFVLGGIARANQLRYRALLVRFGPTLVLPFLLAVITYVSMLAGQFNARYKVQGLLTVGLTAIPFLHAIVLNGPLSRSRLLLALSPYVFAIYLFNVLLIGGAKAVLNRLVPWTEAWFPLYIVVLFTIGLLGPVLLKRFIFKHIPVLDRLTS